jgi:hypothetical protein
MDSWIWYQVSLELGNIDVEGTIESEGSGQRGDNLGNESVQVSVSWSLDIKISSADIIDGLVIKDNSNIGMLEEGMGGED